MRSSRTWMYRITANCAVDARDASAAATAPSRSTADLEPADLHAGVPARGDGRVEPTTLDQVGAALDELPPKLRAVVVLKDVYGLSHEAIAEELGISVAAAKVRLHRGRRAPARRALRGDEAPMRCDEVADLLPGLVDGTVRVDERTPAVHRVGPAVPGRAGPLPPAAPRRSQLLRTRYVEPTPGLLGETLAALDRGGRATARVRTLLIGPPARVRRRDRRRRRRRRRRPPRCSSPAPAAALALRLAG